MNRFQSIGVIKSEANYSPHMLDHFLTKIRDIRAKTVWKKEEIVDLFNEMIPEFKHKETSKYLDERM